VDVAYGDDPRKGRGFTDSGITYHVVRAGDKWSVTETWRRWRVIACDYGMR
jgi:hypothetical protein